ncbi:acetoacyl-CoA synthetase [Salix suchowensis]|nr:acetoacyl-CoA synthetase [Salix suchowensis]
MNAKPKIEGFCAFVIARCFWLSPTKSRRISYPAPIFRTHGPRPNDSLHYKAAIFQEPRSKGRRFQNSELVSGQRYLILGARPSTSVDSIHREIISSLFVDSPPIGHHAAQRSRRDAPLYQPSDAESSTTFRLRDLINAKYGLHLKTYADLHQWSISHIAEFWSLVWDETGVIGEKGSHVVNSKAVPSDNPPWFLEAKMNWAENMLCERSADKIALIEASAYNAKVHPHLPKLEQLLSGLAKKGLAPKVIIIHTIPQTVDHTAWADDWTLWEKYLQEGRTSQLGRDSSGEIEWHRASFDWPLWILFSSGTTGVCISRVTALWIH